MIDNYKVYLDDSGKFELVDIRDNTDVSHYIASTKSSWKKLVSAGYRRRLSLNVDMHSIGGVYLLSYGRKDCIAVQPKKGDYIPPGYTHISGELSNLFSSAYEGRACMRRAVLEPIGDNILINPRLKGLTRRSCLCSGRTNKDYLPGWGLFHANPEHTYLYVSSEGDRLYCNTSQIVLSQEIPQAKVEGRTSLRIQVRGCALSVLIGTTTLTEVGEGIFEWHGDPISEDITLSVVFNPSGISKVEVLDD